MLPTWFWGVESYKTIFSPNGWPVNQIDDDESSKRNDFPKVSGEINCRKYLCPEISDTGSKSDSDWRQFRKCDKSRCTEFNSS